MDSSLQLNDCDFAVQTRSKNQIDFKHESDDGKTEDESTSLPIVVDDLINLYDSYNLYLINEEVVCTEPFDYEQNDEVNDIKLDEVIAYVPNDQYDIEDHYVESSTENPNYHQCLFCDLCFEDESDFIKHNKIHEMYSCSQCDLQFNTKLKLRRHNTKFHGNNYTISAIENSTVNLSLTSSDISINSDKGSTDVLSTKPYACQYCDIRFARIKARQSHEKMHTGLATATVKTEQFACKKCAKNFSYQKLLDEHITCDTNEVTKKKSSKKKKKIQPNDGVTITKPPPLYKVACSECSKMFPTKQKMHRHKWIHRKKAFSCEVCATSFLLQIELDNHRLSEHAEQKKYMCSECGKSFASRQGLWEHNRLHDSSNQVPYNCGECGKTISSRQGYLIHLRTHTGEKPFLCTFCDKSFRDGGTLRKHLRIHTGERPHKCPLCERCFNQKVVMREHIRWVHASNKIEYPEPAPYICALCIAPGALMDREELCTHIVSHSDQIAAIIKEQNKNNQSNETKSDSDTDQLTDEPLPNGFKCDKNVIRKNRKLLQKFIGSKTKAKVSVSSKKKKPKSVETSMCNEQQTYHCEICGFIYETKELLCDHIRMHIMNE